MESNFFTNVNNDNIWNVIWMSFLETKNLLFTLQMNNLTLWHNFPDAKFSRDKTSIELDGAFVDAF